jgi:hypothetical protein
LTHQQILQPLTHQLTQQISVKQLWEMTTSMHS